LPFGIQKISGVVVMLSGAEIMRQGELWLREGRLDQAAHFFRDAVTKLEKARFFENACRSSYLGAECFMQLGQAEEADRLSAKAVELSSHCTDVIHQAAAYLQRGSTLVQMGRWKDSLIFLDHGLKLNPQPYKAWVFRGIALDELGRSREALTSFETAIRQQPFEPLAIFHKAVCLQKSGDLQGAVEYYQQAISLDAKNADFRNNYASALRQLKEFPLAEQ
jgi:tetratricopeptide (TPR) repeat protein